MKVVVFDILGRPVRTLVDEWQNAGEHKAVFEAEGLPSGVYFYKLETQQFSSIRRMALVR